MKKINSAFIASLFLLPLAASDRTGLLQDAMRDTVAELESVWNEDACETVYVKKKGYPLASIACSGSYDRAKRAKFLDTLFRHNFILKDESYKLRPRNGMYLYKTVYQRKTVYFKLFVRDAQDLWPKNPVQGKQVALYVQNVRSGQDLLRWRTLGIPLTYGITFGRSDTKELMTQALGYGDEVWLAMPLEDDRIEVADGNLLSISDALDAEKLNEYLAPLDNDEGITGASSLYCSRFCKNVPALRALFAALKEKNNEKELILLDADRSELSSFYETGRIMNFRTFRAQVPQEQNGGFCRALNAFAGLNSNSASRIMAVDAGNESAFKCLKQADKTRAEIDFVRISAMSLTNPFR